MKTLCENDLQITLPSDATGRKFDDTATHRLSHCMKAVDFIVEHRDRIYFIEVKDPDTPTPSQPPEQFTQRFLSGELDANLKTKYRDTFLYEWASGRVRKPIYYLVLVGARTLTEAELLTRTDSLKRNLPLNGPDGQAWPTPLVTSCVILNIAAWNSKLPDFPVSRLSGTPL